MSTDYVTGSPMSMLQFKKHAKKIGWEEKRTKDGPVMTDGENFAHHDEITDHEGKKRVAFTRFGMNDVESLADHFDAPSEHDEDYHHILFGPEEDDEENDAAHGVRNAINSALKNTSKKKKKDAK